MNGNWLRPLTVVFLGICLACSAVHVSAADTTFPALAADRYVPADGVGRGSLLVCGGGSLPDKVYEVLRFLAGRDQGQLVLIPTASANADNQEQQKKRVEAWRQRGFSSVVVLHTRDRKVADTKAFCEPLTKATAVWIGGGQQSRLAEAYVGTQVERELHRLLARGGVIGGTSAGAAIQSRLMIAGGRTEPQLMRGLDLLPDAVIDQHFRARKREPRLRAALAQHKGRVGFGIAEKTALLVRGRALQVIGEATVTVILSAGAGRPEEVRVLRARDRADLTALRRAARDRLGSPFPEQKLKPPRLAKGSLIIVGGGGMPAELVKRFIQLAGGPTAKIVILPTAIPDPLPPDDRFARMFTRMGAKNVVVLRQRSKPAVESKAFLETLGEAGGVWFSGGRQWRFADAYEHTRALPALHQVLQRGGVIGGSSAGASIQAEYMVRGNPLGNRDMMAAGYERGFGFLKGVAIDQHFTQRQRFNDLEAVIKRFPQLLGIGIDESTGIVVQGSVAEVVGKHKTHFLDGSKSPELPAVVAVEAGRKYDLVKRAAVPK